MSTAIRQPARPRRIDDALSQLVDSLTPPLPITALQDEDLSDVDEALAAAEERRHNAQLDRAWHTLDTNPNAPTGPAETASPGGRRGTISDNVNNAADLIKRKLRHEHASPELAVKFSNMYSKLLTQPVLSQKWGILYLLYKLSDNSGYDPNAERSRSPLMDDGNLQSMLGRGRSTGRPAGPRPMDSEDDEGPAVSSSASQRPPQPSKTERQSTLQEEWEEELASYEREKERAREENVYRASFHEPMADRGADARARASSRRPSTAKPGFNEVLPESVEDRLLRDLPFNLQGLSSKNLQFVSETALNLPDNLPVPLVSLLNSLAEPCLLYRELSIFTEGSEGGLVNQSLRAAIANELRSYLGLVATLEAEIRQALVAIGDASNIKGVSKGGVTLKRCMVWTRDATMALRLMSMIVEESRGKPSVICDIWSLWC